MRDENSRNSEVQPESSPERENDYSVEESDTKADEKLDSDVGKEDHLIINNVKQKSKIEKQVLKKTQDTIKMAYSAFTFHDPSSFETSISELKPVSCELPGVSLNEKSTAESKMEQLQKNIRVSRQCIGDSSPIRHMELQQSIKNIRLCTLNRSPARKVELSELKENEIEIGSNSVVHSEKKSPDEIKKEIKTDQTFFSSGIQFMQRVFKWSIKGYEMSSYDHELSSSKNHLHTLSKYLTK